MYLHIAKFAQKNVRPETIFVFDKKRTKTHAALVGFKKIRPDDTESFKKLRDDDW